MIAIGYGIVVLYLALTIGMSKVLPDPPAPKYDGNTKIEAPAEAASAPKESK